MTKDGFHKEKTVPPLPENKNGSVASIPDVIGSYKIESLFEKGGMSILYLGTHMETKEAVIIKVLPKKYLVNKEVVDRFLKEANIISMTNHQNIIKLYEHGKWEGGLFIAIEFVQGISLRQYILQKHVTLKRALEIIIEISYALCHLHMHGVIHRDLKPENIIVPEDGDVKVIDFGIAELLTEDEKNKSLERPTFIGTPIYMSPEQKEDPESVSYPSDIYSLGIIAYELVLGRLSFGQIHLGLMPKTFRKILAKALQPNPKQRYQDVVDFIADVSDYLNSSLIKEEQNIGDQIQELSENLKKTQMILLPEEPPKWNELDIGIVTHKEISPFGLQQGLYQDFFEIADDTYGIIMTDSSLKNKESFVYTAATRGMIRALCKLTTKPEELVTVLNDLITNDPLKHEFSLNYLTIQPKTNHFQYICCGHGNLFYLEKQTNKVEKIINQNDFVGTNLFAEFKHITHAFKSGDILLLYSYSGAIDGEKQRLNEEIEKVLNENKELAAQILATTILKRLKIIFSKTIYESVVSFLCIKYTQH